MSQIEVKRIVRRLVADEAFRQEMKISRVQALASYDLSKEERAQLIALDFDTALGDNPDEASLLGILEN